VVKEARFSKKFFFFYFGHVHPRGRVTGTKGGRAGRAMALSKFLKKNKFKGGKKK
jgi:hypothetical protein